MQWNIIQCKNEENIKPQKDMEESYVMTVKRKSV